MGKDFARGAVVYWMSLIDHDCAIHVFSDVFHAVGDEDDCLAGLVVHFLYQSEDLVAACRVKPGCRFIENNDFRAHSYDSRDCRAALLSS